MHDEFPQPVFDASRGVWHAMLASPFQPRPAGVRVILPQPLEPQRRYPVLYLLPVEAGELGDNSGDDVGTHLAVNFAPNVAAAPRVALPEYGDGLTAARGADIASRFGVICVAPSLIDVPWYGNHATDPALQQERYIVSAVLPFIEHAFPARRDPAGRWLIGFSKSGWGAFTLLLRCPHIFGYAAAWDAPFMLDTDGREFASDWGPMGIREIFGSAEQFANFLPADLARSAARTGALHGPPRLALAPGQCWRAHTESMHALLTDLAIPCAYRDDLNLPHTWASGWLAPLIETLAAVARA